MTELDKLIEMLKNAPDDEIEDIYQLIKDIERGKHDSK